RERICKWLSRIDHASQQHSMISERQAGTGSWFLQSDAYRTWLKKSSQTLFCPGMPGAGKSVLTSIIIADLWNRFRTDDKVVVLFFYSDFRRHEEQSKTSILSSMVRQLVEGRREPSTFMRDFFNASREGLRPPMYEDLVKAFEQEASSYSAVFVLVDALDELQDRVDITDALIKLQAMCRFNMLATSRYIPEIVGMFEGAQTLEIRASDDDVKAYLEAHMHRLPRLVSSDPLLRAEIMRRIGESVAGMFLLAKLHVESLVGKRSIKAVRTTLQRLVTGSDAYDSAYTAAMERIERQIADQAELAKQVLAWIVHAKASITKRELQEALGVEIAEPDIDQENWPDVEDMVSACAGLVTIDENTNLVRLVHYTTQEYFNRTRQRWFPDAECMIAQICTSYLSYAPFGSPHTSGASGLSCYPDYEFYPYAARYWGEHARLAPRTLKAVMDFLRLRTSVEATGNHIYRPYFPVLQKTGWASILSTTSLHLVAYFGLEFAITSVLAESAGPDPRDSNGLTPLMTAALRGHESIVRLLLSQGASVDPTDEGLSALYLAANGGYTDIVKLLLDAGTTVIRKSWQYEPLLCAAQNGHDEVVQLLLQHYGTLPGRNVHSAQALFQAAKGGNYRTVKLLSQMAGTITIANYLRPTPLHAAVNQDSVAIVRLLLERKASVNTIDQLGWTPLHTATKRGSEVFVGLFLAQGAHVGVMNISGETPLHLAARGGHFAIGRALLDHGAEITTKSWYGETALQLASEHGHVKFVEMLL
ncbi:ankyrin repeat-containing domain protein, partial [Paraphoma chrysanthemicola]